MKLAIKGHCTRGEEVIEILKMLGGINLRKLDGTDHNSHYIIDNGGNISGITSGYLHKCTNHVYYTLEELLEKFPYKVGDEVHNIIHNENQTITDLAWDSQENEIVYQTDNNEYLFVNYLQPYKEETMEEGVYAYNEINCYHQDFGDKVRIRLGNDFEIKVEDKITYIVKKQPQYPKTYKECCKVLMGKTNFQDFGLVLTKFSTTRYEEDDISPEPPHITLINNFYELLICRDAYWKIAGDWKPNLDSKQHKFAISNVGNKISFEVYGEYNSILCFPTEEMRDAFFNNFKDLIEECKELL